MSGLDDQPGRSLRERTKRGVASPVGTEARAAALVGRPTQLEVKEKGKK